MPPVPPCGFESARADADCSRDAAAARRALLLQGRDQLVKVAEDDLLLLLHRLTGVGLHQVSDHHGHLR